MIIVSQQKRYFDIIYLYIIKGVHIKDLRVIAGRDLKDVVLVDNAAYSFGFQLENGIPIIPYYDNKNDTVTKDFSNIIL